MLVHDKVFIGLQENEKNDVLGFPEIQMEKGEEYPFFFFSLEILSFLISGDKNLIFHEMMVATSVVWMYRPSLES